MEKVRQLEFFMTIEDERIFCQKIRELNPNIAFLSTTPSTESDIDGRLFKNTADLLYYFKNAANLPYSFIFSIVNFDLVSKAELSKRYGKYSEYYHFVTVARGQMQFLRSHPDTYDPRHLQHGRIADSYDTEDEEDKKWKNKIYSILRQLGNKVHWYYINLEGYPEIKSKAEGGIVALPNALKIYSGKNGCFMRHDRAKFVGEDIAIADLKYQ